MAPWNGPAPAQPWDVLQADGVLQFYPWRHLVFDAWSKGQLPLWNPYELGGTPLLANSQSGGFYPLHVLIGVLKIPVVPAMTFLAWFHLMWAGLGVYSLSRRLGANRLGALVGGASFSLSPFMVAWTVLPSVITTIAWIPWVLSEIVAVMRPGDQKSTWRFTGLAFCTGMLALAGHLQFLAYGLLAATLFILGLALTQSTSGSVQTVKERWMVAATCFVGLALGLGLAAPQLLPVLEYSKLSHRLNVPSKAGYDEYVGGALQPFELANLTVTNALGSPREPVNVGGHTVSAYWPGFVKRGANFMESAVTVSPLIVGLLFLVPWKRKELWPLMGIGLVTLLLALGTPLNALLYFGVPKWSATGSPGRIIALFPLVACVLGAVAFDIRALAENKKTLLLLGTPLAIGLLFGLGAPNLAPAAEGTAEVVTALKGLATGSAVITILLSSVLAAVGLALVLLPQAAKYRKAIVVIPVAIAWLGYASDMIMTGDPLPISDSMTGQERIAVVNSNWGIPWAPTALYPPNTASLSKIHELGGYDSLLNRDSVGLLQDIDGENPSPPENGNMMFLKPKLDLVKLGSAGVTQLYSLRPLAGLGEPQDASGYLAYKVPGPGRVSATGGEASITEEAYDHQVIDVTPGTTQVLERDRWMPGWTDVRTGNELPTGTWRTLDVASGQTKVELQYRPPGLRTGMIVGLIALLLLVVSKIWERVGS